MTKNPAGFTLLEMMLAMGIGVLGVFAFSSAILQLQKSEASVRTKASLEEVSLMVRRSIMDRRSLAMTISNNPVMKNLSTGVFVPPFEQVQSNVYYPISLYSATGMKIAGTDEAPGAAAAPVYYTTEGFSCTTPGVGKCLISAAALFMIQGWPRAGSLNNAAPTDVYPSWNGSLKPEFITIRYSILYLDSAVSGISRKPIMGTVFIDFKDIAEVVGP